MLRNSRVSKNVPLLLWWPQSPYASPLLALAWADRITWQHAWVIIQKKTTPEKPTVKCTWTAVLTPKPTRTERIETPDWRDSNRKIQRCSQIISINDQRKTKSKWCLCVYQVKQESFHQPWSHSGLGCVCTTHFFIVRRQIWTFAAHSGHSSVKSERK